jgi:hypothetical protein
MVMSMAEEDCNEPTVQVVLEADVVHLSLTVVVWWVVVLFGFYVIYQLAGVAGVLVVVMLYFMLALKQLRARRRSGTGLEGPP